MASSRPPVSLSRYRAQQAVRQYAGLPSILRTRERTAPVVEQICQYAWEPLSGSPPHPSATREVCRRLEEFVAAPQPANAQVLRWLHDHQLAEAWMTPAGIRDFVADCLRDGGHRFL